MVYLYIKLLLLTLLLFDVRNATASATQNNCPRGWTDATEYGMGCLLFNVNQTTTWPEAQHFCYNLDHEAALVEIYSVMQQEFMEAKAFEIEALSGTDRIWWIGATDIGSEGVWYWAHSHRLVDFSAWYPGQPDNKYVHESYATLWSMFDYKWNDNVDDNKSYGICQKI